jgi:hypothetical protein
MKVQLFFIGLTGIDFTKGMVRRVVSIVGGTRHKPFSSAFLSAHLTPVSIHSALMLFVTRTNFVIILKYVSEKFYP